MCGPTPNGVVKNQEESAEAIGSVILQGVVGSTAYGLAREGSDVDRLGIFVTPTLDLVGLSKPKETHVGFKPDITLHEVGKYLSLALKCNPTILELLWLEEHEIRNWWGDYLIAARDLLLSETYVRSAYHGYALQQVHRLQRRQADGKQGFGDVPVNRTAKHARHCMRLLRQGRELLATGRLTIQVPDPEFYWQFDDASVEDIVRVFETESRLFGDTLSVLPIGPDVTEIGRLLRALRRDHVWPSSP